VAIEAVLVGASTMHLQGGKGDELHQSSHAKKACFLIATHNAKCIRFCVLAERYGRLDCTSRACDHQRS
jgi:hypothetical protein